jgi:predicted MPP superfamily phosphohydrolase
LVEFKFLIIYDKGKIRMKLFFFIFSIISALLATYITWRLFSNAAFRRIWKIAIALGIVGTLFLPVIMLILRRTGVDNSFIDVLVWSGYLGVGFLSFVFTYLVIRDLLWLPAVTFNRIKARISKSAPKKAASNPIENPSRRGFLINSMNYGIVATAALSTGYGIAEAKQTPEVKEVPIPITDLPENFEGFRIVQITDVHISPTFRRSSVEEIVEVVNTLNADIVALTGDLVDGTVAQLAHDVAPLGKIKSARGNYFVTGNHEYYSGVIEWIAEVRRLGFTVLINEHRIITSGQDKMLLAGVTDYRQGRILTDHRSDPQKARKAAPKTDIKILLAHQPKSIFDAARAGYDLQISGHTHGGQFFPWNFVVGLTQPYVSGLHKHQDTQIYVSRGTGYWGPPVRVGSPSEITLIKLVSG